MHIIKSWNDRFNDLLEIISGIRNELDRYMPEDFPLEPPTGQSDRFSWLNSLWFYAPDKRWLHDIPGWGTMCDLLSDFEYDEDI